jgi:tetratricopeptide (TPR) repeat protein
VGIPSVIKRVELEKNQFRLHSLVCRGPGDRCKFWCTNPLGSSLTNGGPCEEVPKPVFSQFHGESRDLQQHCVLLRIVLLVPLLLGSTIKGEAVREDRVFLTAAHQENKPFASFLQTEERRRTAKSLLGEGLKYLEQARYEQAIRAFRHALDLDPTLVTARYDLGVAHFAVGQIDEARQALEDVLRRNPGHSFATYFLARVDLVEGQVDSAIRGFRKLLVAQKNVADELYYLGSAYFRKQDLPQAIHFLQKAATSTPADYRIHLLLGHAYRKADRMQEAAQAYALSEQYRSTYRRKSREILECNTLLNSHALELSLQQCRQLLDGVDPLKLVSFGVLLAERQLYDEAIPPLAKAAQLDPENFEPHFNLGLTYFRIKKYQEAKGPLEMAARLRPEFYDAVALLGSTLFALGDDYGAVRHLRHAYQLRPSDEKVKSLLFEQLRIIAQHLISAEQYKDSIEYLQQALTLMPESAELQSQLAQATAAAKENGPAKQ